MVSETLLVHPFKDDWGIKWVKDSSSAQFFETVQGKEPHFKGCEKNISNNY